jgi:hypothetical protein
VKIAGTVINTGANLAVPSGWSLNGGTITGGTVTVASGAQLAATGSSTLTGVTLAGQLNVTATFPGNDATVTVNQGLTLSNGVVQISGDVRGPSPTASLVFAGAGTQTLGGTGQVVFAALNGSSPGTGVGLLYSSAGPLTLGSGVTVSNSNGSGTLGSSAQPLTVNGTVTASASQAIVITGSAVSNNGIIAASGGGTATVQNASNYSNGKLTGGTWQVTGASTLRVIGANVSTNAATILLDGANAHFYQNASTTNALAAFATNASGGNFTLQNGATFTAAGSFTNAGTLTIGSGSTFAPGAAGSYTQITGVTHLAAGTLGAPGTAINVNGGALSGPGTVKGDLTNAGERQQPPGGAGRQAAAPLPGLPAEAVLEPGGRAGALPDEVEDLLPAERPRSRKPLVRGGERGAGHMTTEGHSHETHLHRFPPGQW